MITRKHGKHFCFTWFFKRAPMIAAFLIIGLFPFSAKALDILLGTGEPGTFSHFTGRTICRMINKFSDDLTCKTVVAPDDVHNITNLRGGALDIGLIDSRLLYDAINKTGYFKFFDISYENLRTLFPLYDIPVTLVVRRDAGITSLEALKGKRINTGAPISLENLAFDTIMKAKNWSKADFSLIQELPASQSQDTMAFCYGTVQAMVHIGVHPDRSLQQLLERCKASLANMDDNDIEKLVNDHPALFKTNITVDTYPSQPKGVTTFGTRMTLVTSDALDAQTVYKIIDVIYKNQKRLRGAHQAFSSFTVRATQKNDAGIQAHPGAVKFFSEHGL
ncbi:MAG: TAXI family TRAP transporter solute-binding subunit [Deltaproteobacteria bacterium]|nr:MAG: TAXI family TRAP transporter solute-binding subunit [Deltaproteobacteria bacterium]